MTEKILVGEQRKNIKHPSHTFTIFTYIFPESSCIYLYTKYICCSITKSCLTLCNPMDYNTPGSPVLHSLPKFAKTSCPLSQDAIQPSHTVTPSSFYPQSFPASVSFPVSKLFTSGGQGIGASASVFPMNIQG